MGYDSSWPRSARDVRPAGVRSAHGQSPEILTLQPGPAVQDLLPSGWDPRGPEVAADRASGDRRHGVGAIADESRGLQGFDELLQAVAHASGVADRRPGSLPRRPSPSIRSGRARSLMLNVRDPRCPRPSAPVRRTCFAPTVVKDVRLATRESRSQ